MLEQKIESFIEETLTGDTKNNAIEFVVCLRSNEMLFERFIKDYWEDKLYWLVEYEGVSVCHILINGYEEGHWTIWSDESDSNSFEDFPLDEHLKEIAWKNVDFCGNCGYCTGGTHKTVFGKEFDNVCRTTMIFSNPNAETLEFMKKMVLIRKHDIIANI